MALPMGVLRFGKHIHFTGPAWENCPLCEAVETRPRLRPSRGGTRSSGSGWTCHCGRGLTLQVTDTSPKHYALSLCANLSSHPHPPPGAFEDQEQAARPPRAPRRALLVRSLHQV